MANVSHPAPAEERPYTIGPDDLLNVVVWKNESLSKEVRVRPDGKITLPLINDVQAAGLAPNVLRDVIAKRLEKFIEVSGVTVMVKEINSSKVSVLGQVKKPGIYPLRGELTVLEAIALAEGFNEFAATDRMVIIRKNGKETNWIKVRYTDMIQGRVPNDHLFLAAGDTLVVP
ncbi:MAG TPA: polysaccharide biosynthesis/export family protein [Candidatus Manganitrophaceae bacterium]|nr:polysaccharide biosynthesis/export family protein [Candidatus Manganitrophaceae bacterium]